jgi:hypothetical protein
MGTGAPIHRSKAAKEVEAKCPDLIQRLRSVKLYLYSPYALVALFLIV